MQSDSKTPQVAKLNAPARTWDEIKQMTSFGQLWYVNKRINNKLMCVRIKRKEGTLFVDLKEKKTFKQNAGTHIDKGDILTFINGEKYPGIIKMITPISS